MTTPAKAPKSSKGRPKQVWYDSMAQWAAVTGRPLSDAKRAKLDSYAGKRFFRHTRVSSWLVYWIDGNPSTVRALPEVSEKERLQAEKLFKENRKLDFEYEIEQKTYIKAEEAKSKWSQAIEASMNAMKGYMTREDYNACIKQIKAKMRELDL